MEATDSFPNTVWPEILAASEGDPERASRAFGRIYETYWKPLYLVALHKVRDHELARDHVQAFFTEALAKHYFLSADPAKGRFRCFLLTAFKRFLANAYDRDHAFKRGGGQERVELDTESASQCGQDEPDIAPDLHYDIACAHAILEKLIARLIRDYRADGRSEEFEALRGHLPGQGDPQSYDEISKLLRKTEPAVRKKVERLRRHFGELLRTEISVFERDPVHAAQECGYLVNLMLHHPPPSRM